MSAQRAREPRNHRPRVQSRIQGWRRTLQRIATAASGTAGVQCGYTATISRRRMTTNKKPGLSTGLFDCWIAKAAYAASSATAASSPSASASSAVGLTVGLGFGLGLGAAARALGELAFDFLDRFGFRHVLHDRDFARQPIERGFIELTFAVGLLGLRFRAIEIAHDFGDRDDVSGIDLGFVFLGPARPHRALDARAALQGFQRLLDQRRLRQLAHADIGDLRGRHPQRHLVLHEIDHEQLKLGAGDLLLLDGQDLANAMGGIDHEFVGLEALTLGQRPSSAPRRAARRQACSRLGGGDGLVRSLAWRQALTGVLLAAALAERLSGQSWRRPSKQWPSNRSLSRQFLQSCLALRFFCFLRILQPRPWRRSGYPSGKPGHGSWLHCGWPQRLSSKPWKHSFYAFSVTQPARGTATPLFDVFTGTHGATSAADGFGL